MGILKGGGKRVHCRVAGNMCAVLATGGVGGERRRGKRGEEYASIVEKRETFQDSFEFNYYIIYEGISMMQSYFVRIEWANVDVVSDNIC